MKDQDKNRDPERARKRAVSDARCALKKLGMLSELERWVSGPNHDRMKGAEILFNLAEALNIMGTDQ